MAVGRIGLLITGASGSGKSGLALQLMALGAVLIADDRCCLTRNGDHIRLTCPDTIQGLIEARGIGLLRSGAQQGRLHSVVSLDVTETHRLPPQRSIDILGLSVPLLHKVEAPHFPAALLQYVRGGRRED